MAAELSLLKGAVADVLGLQGTVEEERANVEAEQIQSQGSQGEIDSYNRAADIAERNAALEGTLGDIQEFQLQRQVGKSIGTQAAEVSGGGFSAESGTAVALLRESLQQGYLGTQLLRTQTQQEQGGYLEQAAAARGEAGAVGAQIAASNRLAEAQTNAANVAAANAASESAALKSYLEQNPPETPEEAARQELVTSTLRSPLNGPASLPASVNPATAGSLGLGQFDGGGVTLGQLGGEPGTKRKLGAIDGGKPAVNVVVQGG